MNIISKLPKGKKAKMKDKHYSVHEEMTYSRNNKKKKRDDERRKAREAKRQQVREEETDSEE